ncbi:hypothetical protein ACLBP2_22500, partial [Klebsiella pneumoniae]
MKRLSLFPRSLRQLVTLSFVLILLPLLVLAWQAWQSLNALSAQAAHINRTTLVDARRSEAMINAALEMERSYRPDELGFSTSEWLQVWAVFF